MSKSSADETEVRGRAVLIEALRILMHSDPKEIADAFAETDRESKEARRYVENAEKASARELDALQKSSVFDFLLYCDSNRIGSFLSQFDNYLDNLEKVIQRENVSRESSEASN